jgi:hypothetical protein
MAMRQSWSMQLVLAVDFLEPAQSSLVTALAKDLSVDITRGRRYQLGTSVNKHILGMQ